MVYRMIILKRRKRMKKLLIAAGLLTGLAVSQTAHARWDTFINDTAYRATGKVVYRTGLCSNNPFDLAPGATMDVDAKSCQIDKIETTVYVDIISDPNKPRTRASAKYDEVGA